MMPNAPAPPGPPGMSGPKPPGMPGQPPGGPTGGGDMRSAMVDALRSMIGMAQSKGLDFRGILEEAMRGGGGQAPGGSASPPR